MRGPPGHQVEYTLGLLDARATSKHEAKARVRERGVRGWHEVGLELDIHSHRTMDVYRDNMTRFAKFLADQYGIRDLEQASADHVRAFLLDKMEWKERRFAGGEIRKVRGGVSWSVFQQYIAAFYKLAKGLRRHAEMQGTGREYAWEETLEQIRSLGKEKLKEARGPQASRAYKDPEALVERIERMGMGTRFSEEVKLGARLQWEAGIRVRELQLIRIGQLQGIREDPYTGELRGWITVKGKGGKVYETCMSRETYLRLESYLRAHEGEFRLSYNKYIDALRVAARVIGDSATGKGTHGLRWSRAQKRFLEVSLAVGPIEAQYIVSREMGHERPDITLHYLERARGGKLRSKNSAKKRGRRKTSPKSSARNEQPEVVPTTSETPRG